MAYDYMARIAVELTDRYAPYLHVANYPARDQYPDNVLAPKVLLIYIFCKPYVIFSLFHIELK